MNNADNTLHNNADAGNVWKENNVIVMLEQNSVWREVLSLGARQCLDKGQRLIDSSDNDNFSFLHKGLIRLSSLGENGNERIFLHIGAGCIFNELGCMHIAPLSTASFLAMEPCEIYQFPRRLLQDRDFTLRHPELMMNLVQSLMLKAGAFFGQIEESVGLSPENLVCRYLARLQSEGSGHLRPRFSQSDLALALGLHRSTVCRILHDLREKGVLGEFTRTRLEILDKDALLQLCRMGK